jgi:hypothetical protein
MKGSIVKNFNSEEAVYKSIGGFFYLRFVAPAITAPQAYGSVFRHHSISFINGNYQIVTSGLLETPPSPVRQTISFDTSPI